MPSSYPSSSSHTSSPGYPTYPRRRPADYPPRRSDYCRRADYRPRRSPLPRRTRTHTSRRGLPSRDKRLRPPGIQLFLATSSQADEVPCASAQRQTGTTRCDRNSNCRTCGASCEESRFSSSRRILRDSGSVSSDPTCPSRKHAYTSRGDLGPRNIRLLLSRRLSSVSSVRYYCSRESNSRYPRADLQTSRDPTVPDPDLTGICCFRPDTHHPSFYPAFRPDRLALPYPDQVRPVSFEAALLRRTYGSSAHYLPYSRVRKPSPSRITSALSRRSPRAAGPAVFEESHNSYTSSSPSDFPHLHRYGPPTTLPNMNHRYVPLDRRPVSPGRRHGSSDGRRVALDRRRVDTDRRDVLPDHGLSRPLLYQRSGKRPRRASRYSDGSSSSPSRGKRLRPSYPPRKDRDWHRESRYDREWSSHHRTYRQGPPDRRPYERDPYEHSRVQRVHESIRERSPHDRCRPPVDPLFHAWHNRRDRRSTSRSLGYRNDHVMTTRYPIKDPYDGPPSAWQGEGRYRVGRVHRDPYTMAAVGPPSRYVARWCGDFERRPEDRAPWRPSPWRPSPWRSPRSPSYSYDPPSFRQYGRSRPHHEQGHSNGLGTPPRYRERRHQRDMRQSPVDGSPVSYTSRRSPRRGRGWKRSRRPSRWARPRRGRSGERVRGRAGPYWAEEGRSHQSDWNEAEDYRVPPCRDGEWWAQRPQQPPSPYSDVCRSPSREPSEKLKPKERKEEEEIVHFEWQVGMWMNDRYQILGQLGEGTFGRVVNCIDHISGEEVAIKIVRDINRYTSAAKIEAEILEEIRDRDPERQSNCVILHERFLFDRHPKEQPGSDVSAVPARRPRPVAGAGSLREKRRSESEIGSSSDGSSDRSEEDYGPGVHMCLVSEKLGLSLFAFLSRNQFCGFFMEDIQSITREVLKALAFLHGIKLTHTDLKPENILFLDDSAESARFLRACHPRRFWDGDASESDTDPEEDDEEDGNSGKIVVTQRPRSCKIKLIDFGSATFEDDSHCSLINTRQYRAPEVILQTGWSMPSDMWCLGCILMELYTGVLLFRTHEHLEHLALMEAIIGPIPYKMLEAASKTEGAKYLRIRRGEPLGLDWPHASAAKKSITKVATSRPLEDMVLPCHRLFAQFIRFLLQVDPDSRPTPMEALRHPFLSAVLPEC